ALLSAAQQLNEELKQHQIKEDVARIAAALQAAYAARKFQPVNKELLKLERITGSTTAIPEEFAAGMAEARVWRDAQQAEIQRHLVLLEGYLDDHADTRQVRWELRDIE